MNNTEWIDILIWCASSIRDIEFFRKNIKTNRWQLMIRLEMKNCNTILTEEQKKLHYYLEKLINMNILLVRKCCPLIKD